MHGMYVVMYVVSLKLQINIPSVRLQSPPRDQQQHNGENMAVERQEGVERDVRWSSCIHARVRVCERFLEETSGYFGWCFPLKSLSRAKEKQDGLCVSWGSERERERWRLLVFTAAAGMWWIWGAEWGYRGLSGVIKTARITKGLPLTFTSALWRARAVNRCNEFRHPSLFDVRFFGFLEKVPEHLGHALLKSCYSV